MNDKSLFDMTDDERETFNSNEVDEQAWSKVESLKVTCLYAKPVSLSIEEYQRLAGEGRLVDKR